MEWDDSHGWSTNKCKGQDKNASDTVTSSHHDFAYRSPKLASSVFSFQWSTNSTAETTWQIIVDKTIIKFLNQITISLPKAKTPMKNKIKIKLKTTQVFLSLILQISWKLNQIILRNNKGGQRGRDSIFEFICRSKYSIPGWSCKPSENPFTSWKKIKDTMIGSQRSAESMDGSE